MRPIVPFLAKVDPEEQAEWLEALPEALGEIAEVKPFSELSQVERDKARVAIVANPDPAEVARLSNLEWVQSLWAGVEKLAGELPLDGPRIVRLTDPQMAETMSEAVLAWTLYLHRDMPRYMAQQRVGTWRQHALKVPGDRTVGILGLGKLGGAAAKRLAANGFTVCGWSRSPKTLAGVSTYSGEEGLAALLERSEILVVLVPLTDTTRGLVSRTELARLPQGASLINFARGPIVTAGDLLDALGSNQLSHAVLDVFDEEPLPPESPFWTHPNVTVLPHISAPTLTHTAAGLVAGNICRFFDTGEIPESVDRNRGY